MGCSDTRFAAVRIGHCVRADMVCTLESGRAVSLHVDAFLSVTERSAACRGYIFDGTRLVPLRRLYPVSVGRPPAGKHVFLKFGDPRRLEREARALERMEVNSVPRVPRKVFAGTVLVGGVMFSVLGTTFFNGVSLASGDVALNEAGVRQLRETLEAVHRCDLVHRDVKPDNIVVNEDGMPILVDFDCAGAIGEKGFRGTVMWASPQALQGHGADPSDDLYSLQQVLDRGFTTAAAHTTICATHSPLTPQK